MESEMYPDYLFVIFSKYINKFFYVFNSSIVFTKFAHTLRGDFPISMEEFVDEIDDDKCTRHRDVV